MFLMQNLSLTEDSKKDGIGLILNNKYVTKKILLTEQERVISFVRSSIRVHITFTSPRRKPRAFRSSFVPSRSLILSRLLLLTRL